MKTGRHTDRNELQSHDVGQHGGIEMSKKRLVLILEKHPGGRSSFMFR